MIIYRILSVFVNFFCSFLAVITVFGLIMVLANPAALLQVFLFGSVVIYGWFANRFYANVISRNQKMTKKQKRLAAGKCHCCFYFFCARYFQRHLHYLQSENVR